MQIEKQNRNLGTVCSDTSGTDCSDSMVPITTLRVVPIQRYRQLMKAKGDYLFFSDQDDVWMPWKLDKSLSVLRKFGGGHSGDCF